MKKKIVSVLLCATMVTGLAMGCGKSSDSSSEKTSDGKTKIRMTYWNNEDTVKTLLDYLEKEVPDVKIEFQFIDNSNYDTVVDTQLSAEEGPDIICESPASALKHAKLGYLEKVNDLGKKYIVMMEMYMHYLESAGLKEHILIKNYSSRTISNCQQPLMNIWTYAKNLKILELNR